MSSSHTTKIQYELIVFKEKSERILDLLNVPHRGENVKRLGGIIDCEDKTSSWYLNGLLDGSNIGSAV